MATAGAWASISPLAAVAPDAAKAGTAWLHPVLRANPLPEGTDPFCRLPSPTLSYRPEATPLGDLMRL